MENLLERLPSGSRIAVIRLRSLGDCVLTTPALALLKSLPAGLEHHRRRRAALRSRVRG